MDETEDRETEARRGQPGDSLRRRKDDEEPLPPLVSATVVKRRLGGQLNHPTRARIYRHLLFLPGDHFRSIMRTLGLRVGTARHHLGVLVAANLIRTKKYAGRVRYYPVGRDARPQVNVLFEKHWRYRDLGTRVLVCVRRMDDASPATVARMLGISRQLALYHLRRLEMAGLVKREAGHYRAA